MYKGKKSKACLLWVWIYPTELVGLTQDLLVPACWYVFFQINTAMNMCKMIAWPAEPSAHLWQEWVRAAPCWWSPKPFCCERSPCTMEPPQIFVQIWMEYNTQMSVIRMIFLSTDLQWREQKAEGWGHLVLCMYHDRLHAPLQSLARGTPLF